MFQSKAVAKWPKDCGSVCPWISNPIFSFNLKLWDFDPLWNSPSAGWAAKIHDNFESQKYLKIGIPFNLCFDWLLSRNLLIENENIMNNFALGKGALLRQQKVSFLFQFPAELLNFSLSYKNRKQEKDQGNFYCAENLVSHFKAHCLSKSRSNIQHTWL